MEANTKKIIGTFPVVLGIYGQDQIEQDYFNEAWTCAVDDGLVDFENRSKYVFSIQNK